MQEINIHRSTPNVNIETNTHTYHLPIASATTLGGIKVGHNLTIETDGTLNAESTEYDLPVATASTLGGIKVGSGLTITDAVLSAAVDASLDIDSTNPVRNSVVSSNLNTLTSGVQTNAGNITTLGNNLSTLSGTVAGHTSSIDDMNVTISGHTDAISANSDAIADNASDIDDLDGSITILEGRVGDAEDAITTLQGYTSTIEALADESLETISYLNMLPSSTWTAGEIMIITRGKIGYLYINLEGSLTIAASGSQVIYTFTNMIPAVKATATLLTDAGPLIGEFDDYSYELSLQNLSASSMTITKVKGCIPFIIA